MYSADQEAAFGWDLEDYSEPKPDEVEDRTSFPLFTVAAYEVTREYGGPEEGGWWYDTGVLICKQVVMTEDEAIALRDEWQQTDFPFTRKRYSVLGGEDYDVTYYDGTAVPEFFPKVRPHYE